MRHRTVSHVAATLSASFLFGVVLADLLVRFFESKYARMFGKRAVGRPDDQQALIR